MRDFQNNIKLNYEAIKEIIDEYYDWEEYLKILEKSLKLI